jgi:DNA-binding NtrC family response regulator
MIGGTDLPEATPPPAATQVSSEFPAEGLDLDRVLADVERGWVLRALELSGGVRKRAAVLLGISFRSLRYRLDKLGLEKGADDPADEPPGD